MLRTETSVDDDDDVEKNIEIRNVQMDTLIYVIRQICVHVQGSNTELSSSLQGKIFRATKSSHLF